MISDEDKQKIKDATDIVQLFSEITQVIPAGTRYKCCCPFHQEKTPSMMIDPVAGRYHCFGCGKDGDVISFVMERERISFMEALRYLADRAGIQIEEDPQAARKSQRTKLMKSCCAAAVDYYHRCLTSTEDSEAQLARSYLAGRKMDAEVCTRWNIGYAPGKGKLFAYLIQQGFTRDIIEAVNLGFVKGPQTTDRFYQRIIFPIHNERGEAIAFGGRVLGDGEPKYLNSSETPIFQKKRTLFALNRAKDSIVQRKNTIITEGYTDVIACHEAGFTNVVATLGTACTIEHLTLLHRFAPRITFVFDGDAAGIKAAERIVDFAHQTDADLYCALLPNGLDPAECLDQLGPEGFEHALQSAIPLYQFVIDRKLDSCTSAVPEERQRAMLQALSVLKHVLDLPVAQYYVDYISVRMGVEQRRVAALLGQVKPVNTSRSLQQNTSAQPLSYHSSAADDTAPHADNEIQVVYTKQQTQRIRAEQRLLTILVNYPHLVEVEHKRLEALEWTHVVTQEVAQLMLAMDGQATHEDMRALLAHVGERAQRMVALVDLGIVAIDEALAHRQILSLIGTIRADMLAGLIDRCTVALKTGEKNLSFLGRPDLEELGDTLEVITRLQQERCKLLDWVKQRDDGLQTGAFT